MDSTDHIAVGIVPPMDTDNYFSTGNKYGLLFMNTTNKYSILM